MLYLSRVFQTKVMKPFIMAACILVIMVSCKSTQYTPKDYPGHQLIIGTYGGVTGMMHEYVLLDNGALFLSKGIKGEWKPVRRLKKSETHTLFKTADTLGIDRIKFKHPGNVTSYLMLKDPSRTYEIQWGASGIPPPEPIKRFYDHLVSVF